MNWQIITGDCIEVMRDMDDCSMDAVVCDPPYGLEFMGHDWDKLGATNEAATDSPGWRAGHGGEGPASKANGVPFGGAGQRIRYGKSAAGMFDWHHAWAVEALRVLKPGGHLVAFGGTRTYHWLTVALEVAGFEIRESLMYMFGSGFPKSHSVGPAIDKHLGADREVVGASPNWRESKRDREVFGSMEVRGENAGLITTPATLEAEQWEGWGTALKPAYEPIVLARKPLDGTVAENVLRWGTGGLNIDGCRIGAENGRWPANVVLDEAAAELLDTQAGERKAGGNLTGAEPSRTGGPGTVAYGEFKNRREWQSYNDKGGPSRFFYTAKASRAERDAGLDGFEEQRPHRNGENADGRQWDIPGSHSKPRRNVHPTVKPIDLMRWLVRLVTPPGGLILDPFTGSGSTGCAAILEGFDFIGMEREPRYVEIAEARIKWWEENRADLPANEIVAAVKKRPEGPTLFDLEAAA